MRKAFMCSLCRHGILGGAMYLEPESVTYRSEKLTIDPKYRNLVLPMDEIREVTWKWILFPVATFQMRDGTAHTFLIFNKWRFEKYFREYRRE